MQKPRKFLREFWRLSLLEPFMNATIVTTFLHGSCSFWFSGAVSCNGYSGASMLIPSIRFVYFCAAGIHATWLESKIAQDFPENEGGWDEFAIENRMLPKQLHSKHAFVTGKLLQRQGRPVFPKSQTGKLRTEYDSRRNNDWDMPLALSFPGVAQAGSEFFEYGEVLERVSIQSDDLMETSLTASRSSPSFYRTLIDPEDSVDGLLRRRSPYVAPAGEFETMLVFDGPVDSKFGESRSLPLSASSSPPTVASTGAKNLLWKGYSSDGEV